MFIYNIGISPYTLDKHSIKKVGYKRGFFIKWHFSVWTLA